MSKELKSLFEGMELAEGFESKVETIFGVAVQEAAEEKAAEEIKKVEEAFEKKLKEAEEQVKKDAEEKVQEAVDKAIVEWATANTVALESQVKVAIAESFLADLKSLFLENQVALPEADSKPVIEALQAEVSKLKEQLEDSKKETEEEKKVVESFKRQEIIDQLTEGLADTQRDRIKRLTKEFSFVNESEFKEKVGHIVEAFGEKKQEPKQQEQIQESAAAQVVEQQVNESAVTDPFMANLLKSFVKPE